MRRRAAEEGSAAETGASKAPLPARERRPRRRVLLTRRERRIQPGWTPLRRVLKSILGDHDVEGTLSVVFVSDSEMSRLHEEFLGEDRPTDVLSFPLAEDSFPLAEDSGASHHSEAEFGEVVVSLDTAQREAGKRDLPVAREVALYAIHGTLHLMGLDDVTSAGRREMRGRERHYVKLYRQLGGE